MGIDEMQKLAQKLEEVETRLEEEISERLPRKSSGGAAASEPDRGKLPPLNQILEHMKELQNRVKELQVVILEQDEEVQELENTVALKEESLKEALEAKEAAMRQVEALEKTGEQGEGCSPSMWRDRTSSMCTTIEHPERGSLDESPWPSAELQATVESQQLEIHHLRAQLAAQAESQGRGADGQPGGRPEGGGGGEESTSEQVAVLQHEAELLRAHIQGRDDELQRLQAALEEAVAHARAVEDASRQAAAGAGVQVAGRTPEAAAAYVQELEEANMDLQRQVAAQGALSEPHRASLADQSLLQMQLLLKAKEAAAAQAAEAARTAESLQGRLAYLEECHEEAMEGASRQIEELEEASARHTEPICILPRGAPALLAFKTFLAWRYSAFAVQDTPVMAELTTSVRALLSQVSLLRRREAALNDENTRLKREAAALRKEAEQISSPNARSPLQRSPKERAPRSTENKSNGSEEDGVKPERKKASHVKKPRDLSGLKALANAKLDTGSDIRTIADLFR